MATVLNYPRTLFGAGLIALASLVIAACGGSQSTSSAADAATGGALRWLPAQQTMVVVSTNLSAHRLDEGLATLQRVPAWGLVELQLPASDGAGLRKLLLPQVVDQMTERSSAQQGVTATKLEAAFGDRAGAAILGSRPDGVAWVQVDDAKTATSVMAKLVPGTEQAGSYKGVDYLVAKDGEPAYTIEDDLLVLASSTKQLKQLIAVHEGDEDDSLAGSKSAAAVLRGVDAKDALGTAAVHTRAVLGFAKKRAAHHDKQQAEDLAAALASGEANDLIPAWVAGSATIDRSGLRARGAWSDPHELAQPDTSARELVERMPASATTVQATATSGKELERVQSTWHDISKKSGVTLDDLVGDSCPKHSAQLCAFALQLAKTVLEDNSLADALAELGPQSTATVQDASTAASPSAKSALYEGASTFSYGDLDWSPSTQLRDTATAAGLHVTRSSDGSTITLRISRGSQLGKLLGMQPDLPAAATLLQNQFEGPLLLATTGVTIRTQKVDGLAVTTMPATAPSTIKPALEGASDTLGDDTDYQDAVTAAKPPKQTGAFGYTDIRAALGSFAAQGGAAQLGGAQATPIIDKALSVLPGMVWWTARSGSGDDQVGVVEISLPIRS